MKIEINRKQYMAEMSAGVPDAYDRYYNQFDTPAVRRLALMVAPLPELVSAYKVDKNLNTIALKRWDIANHLPQEVLYAVAVSNTSTQAEGSGKYTSMSDRVCVLKHAAINMVREYLEANPCN